MDHWRITTGLEVIMRDEGGLMIILLDWVVFCHVHSSVFCSFFCFVNLVCYFEKKRQWPHQKNHCQKKNNHCIKNNKWGKTPPGVTRPRLLPFLVGELLSDLL